MKKEVGNVGWPFCKYQLLSLGYEGKIMIFIYALKMLKSQSRNKKPSLKLSSWVIK